jgi:ferric-dicitrate binding protein FerR (iron transport regulator)
MKTQDSNPNPREPVDAALWYTKLDRGLTDAERDDFERALDSNEMLLVEIDAYARTVETIKKLPFELLEPSETKETQTTSKIIPFPMLWMGIAAAVTLFAAGFLFFVSNTPEDDPLLYAESFEATTHAYTQILPDETILRVSEDTKFSISYSSDVREVSLSDGELYFDVQSDPDRPFSVKVEGFSIRVVGTEFSINTSEKSVVVTEGEVSLSLPAISAQETANITQGHTLVVHSETPIEIRKSTQEEIRNALSWNQSLVDPTGSSLLEIAENFETMTGYKLVIADTRLNDFMLGGIFPSSDVERFLDVLEKVYDIPVRRSENVIILGIR